MVWAYLSIFKKMKTIYLKPIITVLIISGILFSCNSDEVNVDPDAELKGLIMLAEKAIPNTDLSAKIYQYTDDLIVGYNKFEILINKTGSEDAYTNAEIVLKPMMDMGAMKHASPVENPVLNANFDKVFGGAVVFVMPSGEMGTWQITMEVKDKDTDASGEVMLPVEIMLPDESRMRSFTIGDNKYFVSLVEPSAPIVGINPFEVTVHTRKTMMEWPSVNNFTITIEPEMPDMGHGSPNNVNPVFTSNGHYEGKVNFTMDGYWKINMNFTLDGQSTPLSFDMTFSHKSTK